MGAVLLGGGALAVKMIQHAREETDGSDETEKKKGNLFGKK
jgi:hypothetical protein